MLESGKDAQGASSAEASLRAMRRAGLSSASSRLLFALWPQAYAHGSWIEQRLSDGAASWCPRAAGSFRSPGPDAGLVECLAAELLLEAVGASWQDGVAGAWLPAWVHRSPARIRFGLSAMLASCLASMLRRAVNPSAASHLDTLIGPNVRRAALVLAEHSAWVQQSPEFASLSRFGRLSLGSSGAWEQGCLSLGAAILDAQVQPAEAAKGAIARLRLQFAVGTPLAASFLLGEEPLRRFGELLDHPVATGGCSATSTSRGNGS